MGGRHPGRKVWSLVSRQWENYERSQGYIVSSISRHEILVYLFTTLFAERLEKLIITGVDTLHYYDNCSTR